MVARSKTLTLKLSPAEAQKLAALAAAAGLPVRTFCRRELLASEMPKDTLLILAAIGRQAEVSRRFWEALAADELDSERVKEITRIVEAIDDRVLVARVVR